MQDVIRDLLRAMVDSFIPPRKSELLIRTLKEEVLYGLRTPRGLPYHDPRVTALVWELKYYGSRTAANLGGAYLAQEVLAICAEELGTPLLIPVPMHEDRLHERGHHQTRLLCEAILEHLAPDTVQYLPRALVRTRSHPPQRGLPREVRLQNVRDSMQAKNPALIRGRVCIVVDDVVTTEATLQEARRALEAAGASKVHVLALART